MSKATSKKRFLHKPVYPGGQKAMLEFIRLQLRYPEAAQAAKAEGTVRLRITIDHKGKVVDAKPIATLGHGCEEEARRVAGLLRFEVAKNRKLHLLFHKTINFHFHLSKETPVSSPAEVTYHYEITPAPESPDQDKTGQGGYSYSITW
jgi:TonB family protein